MKKRYNRDTEHAARVQKVARITGAKKDTVNAVIYDDRKNDLILSTYMILKETEQEIENILLEEVKKLVPFPLKRQLQQP